MRLALDLGKKAIVLDNISCLFSEVDEDKAREWEKVKLWLLHLRRHRLSPVLVHHTGYDMSHMRGTSKRQDDAAWAIRLDSKKDDFETLGANFIHDSLNIAANSGCSITSGPLNLIQLIQPRSMSTTQSRTERGSTPMGPRRSVQV